MPLTRRAGFALVGEAALTLAAFIAPGIGIAMTWLLFFGVHGSIAALVNVVGQLGAILLAVSASWQGRTVPSRMVAAIALAAAVYTVALALAGPSAL